MRLTDRSAFIAFGVDIFFCHTHFNRHTISTHHILSLTPDYFNYFAVQQMWWKMFRNKLNLLCICAMLVAFAKIEAAR